MTAGTTLILSGRATDPDGNLGVHNLDIQRPAGDWNWQGGFASGEPYMGGPVGHGGDSTRSAGFTFTDPGTYHVRSAAFDGSLWVHSATVAIRVVAPPPVQFTLSTATGGGGGVSPGGTYPAGTLATITATPNSGHDFIGWSGHATGATNPVTILMDGDKSVQAVFALKSYPLATSATVGGSVTPGGIYAHGTTLTITALPAADARFVGWTGDAAGSNPAVAVTMDAAKSLQAIFALKSAQTITFPPPADLNFAAGPVPLAATASSGLPVTYVILTGPATLSGDQLLLTGPGTVTLEARQPGDDFFLPAAPVTRSFTASAPALLRYQSSARTLLLGEATPGTVPYVLQ